MQLGDLLEHHDFGLRLVAGGEAALRRPLAGAHASETPQPSRFLPPDWAMLTLGLRLRHDVAAQRGLIAELDEAGLCALGFGTGVAFKNVPRALLEEADRRAFPVFHIPFETPYHQIVGVVNRSMLNADSRMLQRSLSMQNYLMDALREERPIEALVERLAGLLKSRVLIVDAEGQPVADSGTGPVDAVWAAVREREPSLQRSLVDGSDVLSVRIAVADHPDHWLVVASRRRAVPNQLAAAVIQTTERLLEVITLSRHAAAAEERILRAELLASALQPQDGFGAVELRARLERFGIDFSAPTRVYALAVERSRGAVAERLDRTRRRLERLLTEDGAHHLMAVREPRLLLLTTAEPATLRAWIARLGDEGLAVRAGGGRQASAIDELPASLRDAELALDQLRGEHDDALALFEDFGFGRWLVGITPPEAVAAKLADVLGELKAQPTLYDTLRAFLAANASISATAEALNLHQNSLRYRLSRVEAILGCSLRDLGTLTDLSMAVMADRGARPGAVAISD